MDAEMLPAVLVSVLRPDKEEKEELHTKRSKVIRLRT